MSGDGRTNLSGPAATATLAHVSRLTPRFELISDLTSVGPLVADLFEAAAAADLRQPLSDQLWLDLTHGGRPGSTAAVAHDGSDSVIGYAQSSWGNDTTVVQLVVHPDHREHTDRLGAVLLHAVITAAGTHEAVRDVTWWVAEPDASHHRLAELLGWTPGRRLLQMRRPLPTGEPVEVDVRPFRPGLDDLPWINVNNRAFSAHGEQGGWDLATLHQRMAEEWFDPDGFLVHDRDGRMAGFCWTKLHHDLDPVEGEIYVIAVDPDFHGAGLGRQLTLAGLDAIARRGVTIGMLFVDADNTAAVRLYERLGFSVNRTDVAFTGSPPSNTPSTPPSTPPGAQP
ncbi:mycothiol synthase [soil metagenome]